MFLLSIDSRKVDRADKFARVSATEGEFAIRDRELCCGFEWNRNQILADDSLREQVVGDWETKFDEHLSWSTSEISYQWG